MTDLSAIDRNWREIGDTTFAVWEAEYRRVNSPLLPHVWAMYQVAKPHSALCLAQQWIENQYASTGIMIQPSDNNPLGLRPGPGIEVPYETIPGPFCRFQTPVDCVAEWKRRITSTDYYESGGIYTPTRTLAEFLAIYAPGHDTHPITGVRNADIKYAETVTTMLRRFSEQEGDGEIPPANSDDALPPERTPTMPTKLNMDKGLIPLPKHERKIIGRKNTGFSSLGKREIWGETIHRMQGSFVSAYHHFSDPNVASLTDWGLDHMSGELWQYNDPEGTRSGWASGPYKGGYGDGRAFVERYGASSGVGASVINKMRESVEVSGFFRQPGTGATADSPWSEASMRVMAQLHAARAHDYGIQWGDYPIHPDEGFSFLAWHQEFILPAYSTESYDKICPGRKVMEQTSQVIAMTQDIMKQYQETSLPTPEQPADPQPGLLLYPEGMDRNIAAMAFGRVTGDDDRTYAFNERGPVSRLWLDLGWAGGNESRFPELIEVRHFDNRKYFRFSDGLLIWAPNGQEAIRVLGLEEPDDNAA